MKIYCCFFFCLHRVAAGISKGFVVANFLVKGLVLIHPTVTPDGHGARSVNRYVRASATSMTKIIGLDMSCVRFHQK